MLRAENHVTRLPGGQSEPHVFLCDDGEQWVLKLPGNPQDVALGRDLAGLQLAEKLGVPVPEVTVALVDDAALTTMNPRPRWTRPGLALATRFFRSASNMITSHSLSALADPYELAALLVADIWMETLDRWKPDGGWNLLLRTDSYPPRVLAIDFGFALQTDARLGEPTLIPAAYPREIRATADVAAVREALDRLRALQDHEIENVLRAIPEEWLTEQQRADILAFLLERRDTLISTSPEELCGRFQ